MVLHPSFGGCSGCGGCIPDNQTIHRADARRQRPGDPVHRVEVRLPEPVGAVGVVLDAHQPGSRRDQLRLHPLRAQRAERRDSRNPVGHDLEREGVDQRRRRRELDGHERAAPPRQPRASEPRRAVDRDAPCGRSPRDRGLLRLERLRKPARTRLPDARRRRDLDGHLGRVAGRARLHRRGRSRAPDLRLHRDGVRRLRERRRVERLDLDEDQQRAAPERPREPARVQPREPEAARGDARPRDLGARRDLSLVHASDPRGADERRVQRPALVDAFRRDRLDVQRLPLDRRVPRRDVRPDRDRARRNELRRHDGVRRGHLRVPGGHRGGERGLRVRRLVLPVDHAIRDLPLHDGSRVRRARLGHLPEPGLRAR